MCIFAQGFLLCPRAISNSHECGKPNATNNYHLGMISITHMVSHGEWPSIPVFVGQIPLKQLIQYYSLYKTDPCGCPMNHPGFHKISECHWLWRPSGDHRPPQAPEAVETVDAEQDSQGNSNSGEMATC